MSRFSIQFVIGLVAAVLAFGYILFYLYGRWAAKRDERFVDAVVKGLIAPRRKQQEPMPVLLVTPETIIAQQGIERELRDSEPCIVRSKVRFIQRPTQEDINTAIEDAAVIVVRVPIPKRWRETLTLPEIHKRNIGRCNATLETLDLVGGHPRVMLLSDTCESVPQFRETVLERFGA